MFWSIFLCLWIVFWAAVIEYVLNHGAENEAKFFSCVGKKGWIQAAGLGVGVGLANYLAPMGSGWAIAAFVLVAAAMGYIAWWFQDVSEWKEWILFVLMTAPMSFTLAAAGAGIAEMIQNTFWVSFFMAIPWVLVTALGGFMLTALLFSKYEETEEPAYKVLRWVAMALTILALILQLWSGLAWESINWGKEKQEPATVTEEPVETSDWYYFYNIKMIADDDVKNDYNFGTNRIYGIIEAKAEAGALEEKDVAGKTADELVKLLAASEFDLDLRVRASYDPALGAAVMAWFDANLGTRFLGEFYESCKGNWAETMNEAKVYWMENHSDYDRTLAAFFAFLDTADKVEVVKVTSGLDDQMYMNPYTKDHVPDIIVMETTNHDGYFLRYTFDIKGEKVTVAYRIDCGYQPTNVSKVMNIPAQSNPNTPKPAENNPGKSSGGDPGHSGGGDPGHSSGGDPGHSGGGDPGGSDDPGDPVQPNPKDPAKGTDVGGNDNKGPGPNTNNGVGAQYSSEELPTNSAFETYKEYKEEIKELKEINKNQKVGGDPNTPSTPPQSKETTVDSNADKGTGNGGIDEPTPIHETTVDSNVGGSNKISDDPAGTEWGGPPD